jgi:hypothetical protein
VLHSEPGNAFDDLARYLDESETHGWLDANHRD